MGSPDVNQAWLLSKGVEVDVVGSLGDVVKVNGPDAIRGSRISATPPRTMAPKNPHAAAGTGIPRVLRGRVPINGGSGGVVFTIASATRLSCWSTLLSVIEHLLQMAARPRQVLLDGAFGDPEMVGDLDGRQVLPVGEKDAGPLL